MKVNSSVVPVMANVMLASVMWSSVRISSNEQTTTSLPGRLGDYVNQHVKLSPDEYKRLVQGEPVTKLLPTNASEEVAIFGAVWINESISKYIAAVKNIEQLESGPNFLVTKRISSPPRLEDFAQLTLPPEDVKDLKTCKVEDCELKLGEEALRQIRNDVDWTKPLPQATAQVEALFRRLALEYVTRYQSAGNAGLAAYRDKSRPTFVAQEFKTMIDQMPPLTEYLPQLKTYLLAYPKASLPGADSFLYWQSVKFGLKPTTRINHVVINQQPDGATVATKMLYSNHYFWTAIELRILVPDPSRGKGFWFASISQSRSDGLTGFVGSVIRGRVRDEAQKGMKAALTAGKASLERSSPMP